MLTHKLHSYRYTNIHIQHHDQSYYQYIVRIYKLCLSLCNHSLSQISCCAFVKTFFFRVSLSLSTYIFYVCLNRKIKFHLLRNVTKNGQTKLLCDKHKNLFLKFLLFSFWSIIFVFLVFFLDYLSFYFM